MTPDPLSLLRAGLDEDERIARAAIDAELPLPIGWRDPQVGARWRYSEFEEYGRTVGQVQNRLDLNILRGAANDQKRHIARQDPKATLDRVEAIRAKVIAPYLAAVGAVEATVSARQYAASRHALAAIRLDHGGGDAMEERRTREELLSAEVQLASDVAKRDAYASVIAALASIYAPEPTETGEPR